MYILILSQIKKNVPILTYIYRCRNPCREELLWFYQEGASILFPDKWEDFVEPIPKVERGDLMSAYYRRWVLFVYVRDCSSLWLHTACLTICCLKSNVGQSPKVDENNQNYQVGRRNSALKYNKPANLIHGRESPFGERHR